MRVEDHTDPEASPLPQITIALEKDPESLGALSQVAASRTVSGISRRQERRRRIVLTLPEPPPEGTPLRLVVEEAALQDLFANRPAGTWTHSFAWTSADSVVDDTAPPEVTEVLLRDGHLELSFDEEPDLATALGAIDLGGFQTTWELTDDRHTLRSVETLPEGPHTLTIGTSLTDLVSTGLLAPFVVTFDVDDSGTATLLIFAAPDPRLVSTSAVAHGFGFHGLPVDTETGLVYVRHRYYDPELGRFITTDPLGYFDGPNLYQYALNNPVNFSDPLGLCVGAACVDLRASWEPLHQEKEARKEAIRQQIAQVDAEIEAIRVGRVLHKVDPQNLEPWHRALALGRYFAEKGFGREEISAKVQQYVGPARYHLNRTDRLHGAMAMPEIVPMELAYAEAITTLFSATAGSMARLPSGVRSPSMGRSGTTVPRGQTTVIGKVKDLENLRRGENTLLKHLPDQGTPRANWAQNSGVLRREMAKGRPIRDASVDPLTGELIEYPGSFLNAERSLLRDRGWTYDPATNLWSPPG